MPNYKEQYVFFSLAWIVCKSNSCPKIVLKVNDSQNSEHEYYIEFVFKTIDYMLLYLRILARNVKSHSIDNLRFNSFPAKILIKETYGKLDQFHLFFMPDGKKWPTKDYSAHFLYDFMV